MNRNLILVIVALFEFLLLATVNNKSIEVNGKEELHGATDQEELKILETQLNKNSITGILQNPYNHSVTVTMVQAEFYDKDDGHLVGVRNFGYTTVKDKLDPGEKTTYKIPEFVRDTGPFPNTPFVVTARGIDNTGIVNYSFEEMIGKIKNLSRALNELPSDVYVNVTPQQAQDLELNDTGSNSTGK